MTDLDTIYQGHRGLLLRLGYDITGSWTDAEDIAQQTYLRWRSVGQSDTTTIEKPRAYLARIATNLALDAVAGRERIDYVGPSLPEPLVVGADIAEGVLEAEEVELALQLVLASLSPLERAVFLLHDVFGFPHAEIAATLARSPASVRQLNHRAREHVRARREYAVIDEGALSTLASQFLAAARDGEVDALASMLAADVVAITDGGGKKQAALNPLRTPQKVARFLVGTVRGLVGTVGLEIVTANRRPAIAVSVDGQLDSIIWLLPDETGQISRLYVVRNPDKLHRAVRTGMR